MGPGTIIAATLIILILLFLAIYLSIENGLGLNFDLKNDKFKIE